MELESPEQSSEKTSAPTGKIFAIGIGLLCVMVIASIALMFVKATKDAENRAKHPVIGHP